MRRLFASALEDLLPKLAGKVLLDPTKPVDLSIFPMREEALKASRNRLEIILTLLQVLYIPWIREV